MLVPLIISQIQEEIQKARNILVTTHENPTEDSIGSTLAFYFGLTDLGKQVTVSCPSEIKVGFSDFIGVDRIVAEIGKKNFIISLNYTEGSIEKVSYNINGNTFNLVIEPKQGFPPFSADSVRYSTQGAVFDLIFTIDTIHLGGLQKLYEKEKELFASKLIINIDCHTNNAQYGKVNAVDTGASSTSEVVAVILSGLGVKLTPDIATNLLNGIYGATDSFRNPSVTPRAFEVAAVCLRMGGRLFVKPSQKNQQILDAIPVAFQPLQKQNIQDLDAGEKKQPKKKEDARLSETVSKKTIDEAPDDWLKPKIFKSRDF